MTNPSLVYSFLRHHLPEDSPEVQEWHELNAWLETTKRERGEARLERDNLALANTEARKVIDRLNQLIPSLATGGDKDG